MQINCTLQSIAELPISFKHSRQNDRFFAFRVTPVKWTF